MIKRIKNYLKKREFTRNVLTLMTGTVIAQALPIAITPILTRIYTPSDFGILALFMSLTAITGAISTAKYEEAIVLPKNNSDAVNIVFLGFFITGFISFLLFLIIFFFNDKITLLLGEPKIKNWLYLVPVSVFFIGIYNSLNYYNIRHKKFKNIAKSQVYKSTGLSIIQIAGGVAFKGAFGLISGQIISYVSGNYVLFKALQQAGVLKKKIDKNKIKQLAIKYKKFPIFSMPSILLNSINLNLINFLISSFFSTTILGYYSLTQRILGIPSRIIGNSISQVYYQKATEELNNTGTSINVFKNTLYKLLIISFPIFLFLFFTIEPIFIFVFGKDWAIAGTYAKILVPLAFVRFISGSLSLTLSIFQKQHLHLLINIILVISVILIFYISNLNNVRFINILKVFSLVLLIEYFIFIIIYYQITKNNKNIQQ